MNWRRVAVIIAALAGVGLAGWGGYSWYQGRQDTSQPQPQEQATAAPTSLDDQDAQSGGVETVDVSGGGDANPDAGATPMAQRVAVLGLLNKRNGQARDVTMKPGEATRVGNVIIRLRACEHTAPWEQDQYTGAFVQLDVLQPDKKWKRVHSGWLYKERPSLNVVLDPVYDVWVKSCAMTFPGGGPDTVAAPAGAKTPSGAKRSSAPKSPDAAPSASPSEPPTAAPSNPT
jgi:hypothetical protein